MPLRTPVADLFVPWQLGAYSLAHRVVLPAVALGLARRGGTPTPAMGEFYARSAVPGGLVICEAAAASALAAPHGGPGMHSSEQVNHWRPVVDAVRDAGGTAVAQLALEVERAAPLDEARLEQFLLDYRSAAENAGDAGFDGVELRATRGSLAFELLHAERADCAEAYRGKPQANNRFLDEALASLAGVWGRDRVGLCLEFRRPAAGLRVAGLDVLAFYGRVLQEVERYGLAWLQVHEPAAPGAAAAQPRMSALLRPHFQGTMIVSGGLDIESARQELRAGRAQGVGLEPALLAKLDMLRDATAPVTATAPEPPCDPPRLAFR